LKATLVNPRRVASLALQVISNVMFLTPRGPHKLQVHMISIAAELNGRAYNPICSATKQRVNSA